MLALSGCMTYVNIPPQDGDLASHNPNHPAVCEVLGEALPAIVNAYPVEGQFAILLPDKTTAKTYGQVAEKTGENALWPGNHDRTEIPILDVRQIYIRGQQARVDVVRPVETADKTGTIDQVVTVELFWHPLQGWLPKRVRAWRLPVGDALRLSSNDEDTD